ncbi:hypothetical protein [Alkalibaculum bacchi]|uniref:hypothetical protein n=1 Tax=Alkalibaculum bacchi TaxID=645887 RepID=UPI0026F24FC5|nr:hypothetical protein [Alkalibaculum bacchi]
MPDDLNITGLFYKSYLCIVRWHILFFGLMIAKATTVDGSGFAGKTLLTNLILESNTKEIR